jgi:hypothetical protein
VTAFPHGPPGKLWGGTDDGSVRLFNIWTNELEGSWDCHGYRITSMVRVCASMRQRHPS